MRQFVVMKKIDRFNIKFIKLFNVLLMRKNKIV
jgi:hypothetical protein